MRQAALLILNSLDRALIAAEDLLPLEVVKEVVYLHMEYACDQVRAVGGLLAG